MPDRSEGTGTLPGTGVGVASYAPPEPDPAAAVDDATEPPSSPSEPRHRRAPRRPLSLATFGRQGALAAVALASMAVGLLGFSVAAAITHLPVSYTAFRFDTTWFYRIATHGYLHRVPTGPTDYAGLRIAFFPGLPLVERAVHDVIGGGPVHTTLAVGAIGLILSCIVVWYLVAWDWDEATAWRAAVLVAFFPGAYVFPMAYSEALAIPLAIFTLWALRRHWFLLAGVAAALAGTMRLDALVLVAVCAVAAVRQLRETDRPLSTVVRALASPILAATGVLAYLIYLKSTTGGFFTFTTAEKLGWGDHLSFLATFHQVRVFSEHGFHSTPLVIADTTGLVAVVLAAVLVVAVSMPLEYKVLAIGVLGTWVFTADHGAWFRYVEFAFPVLIAVAVKLPPKYLLPAISVCAGVLGILVVLFASATPFFP